MTLSVTHLHAAAAIAGQVFSREAHLILREDSHDPDLGLPSSKMERLAAEWSAGGDGIELRPF